MKRLKQRLKRLNKLIAPAICLSIHVSVSAGTVAGFGGSTEITQLLNNIQLVASVAKQAAMVEQQIQSNITQVKQLAAMTQNLKNVSPAMLAQTVANYAGQVQKLGQMYTATQGLQQASTNFSSVLSGRMTQMNSLGMTPQNYLAAETTLAQQKGGIYQAQMTADLAALNDVQQRAQQLRTLSNQNPQIDSDIKGLQILVQQTNMMAGELMDMKAAILQQNAMTHQQLAEQANATQVGNSAATTNANAANQLDSRNKTFATGIQFTPSWSH
jgi:conjugal transfer/entry exclusion protein